MTSRLIETANQLSKFLEAKRPDYRIKVTPDFGFGGEAVIFFNGNKDSDNFFMGSLKVVRYRHQMYLACPESGYRHFHIKHNGKGGIELIGGKEFCNDYVIVP